MLACELTAWLQLLALHSHHERRWEPKRLRLRLFTLPATLTRHGRQQLLHLASRSLWAGLAHTAVSRLRLLIPAPG